LATSSANKHNLNPATSVEEAMDQLGDEVGLYIDGGPTPGLSPSTVVDCTTSPVTIVRLGLLTEDQIFGVAGAADA
jgi:tRNA A37 threonylcarbamoyladenosine synthetase subunit TsaC/SUA5/YrdC